MTKRLPEPVKAVHKAWGPRVHSLRIPLSPLEGHVEECAEFAVHEFCHAALLGLPLGYGKAHASHLRETIEAKCNGKFGWHGDRHELHTLAAESLVLRELDVRVAFYDLITLGLKNTKLFDPYHQRRRLSRCIRRARQVPSVKRAAAAVVAFIRNGRLGQLRNSSHEQHDT